MKSDMPTSLSTKRISNVDSLAQSTLPTGALKFDGVTLFQEIMVICHKANEDRSIGLFYEWWSVADDFVNSIKSVNSHRP